VGTAFVDVKVYLPIFLKTSIETDGPGKAEVGGFFKDQATYGLVYVSQDIYAVCFTQPCRDAQMTCKTTW
jgi:hypothetical protein